MTDNIVNIYLENLENLVKNHAEQIYLEGIDFPTDTAEYYQSLQEAEYLNLYQFEENRKDFSIASLGRIAMLEASYAYPFPLCQSIITNYIASLAGIKSDIPFCLFDGKMKSSHNGKWHIYGKGYWCLTEQHRFKQQKLLVCIETDKTLQVGLVPIGSLKVDITKNIAGEPYCKISPQEIDIKLIPIEEISYQVFINMIIFVKIYRIVGALKNALIMGKSYMQERIQFGKSLSSFQAIQHILATLTGEVASVVSSSNHLGTLLTKYSEVRSPDILTKLIVDTDVNQLINLNHVNALMAINKCIHSFHQIHGAIGFTREYPLQRYTRRLLAWRDEFTNPTALIQDLGNTFLQSDSTWNEFVKISDGISITT